MNCPTCSTQMKPLFLWNSYFCPNDCDKKQPVAGNSCMEVIIYTHGVLLGFKDEGRKFYYNTLPKGGDYKVRVRGNFSTRRRTSSSSNDWEYSLEAGVGGIFVEKVED